MTVPVDMRASEIQAIVIPALSEVRSEADVALWLDAAGPGARMVYAAGVSEPRSAPVWRFSRALADIGAVHLVARIDPDHPCPGHARWWHWIIEKRPLIGAGERSAVPCPTSAPPCAPLLGSDAGDLLDWLTLHAGTGGRAALPSLDALGRALGLRPSVAKDRARYLLRVLEGHGLIAIEADGARRVAVIKGGAARSARG